MLSSSQLTFQLYLALFFTLLLLFSMAFIISRALMVSGSSLATSKLGLGQASFPPAPLPFVFLRCNRFSRLPLLSSSCKWSLDHKTKNVLTVLGASIFFGKEGSHEYLKALLGNIFVTPVLTTNNFITLSWS